MAKKLDRPAVGQGIINPDEHKPLGKRVKEAIEELTGSDKGDMEKVKEKVGKRIRHY